jgi:tRNA (guanine37-N1)-methyltransferase
MPSNRPQTFEGRPIPEVLLSGDHGKVAAWRLGEAEALTKVRRPDLWAARPAQTIRAKGESQKTPKNKTDG